MGASRLLQVLSNLMASGSLALSNRLKRPSTMSVCAISIHQGTEVPFFVLLILFITSSSLDAGRGVLSLSSTSLTTIQNIIPILFPLLSPSKWFPTYFTCLGW